MKLKINDYRGHQGRVVSIEKDNIISGPMGSGKSGIIHALWIALLGYDPSLSAPGKKARPADHLLFSEKGKMSVELERVEHHVMRGFSTESPVNRFDWHRGGFVSDGKIDDWAVYASKACPAIFDVSDFTSLSGAAQLKYLAGLMPPGPGSSMEEQKALATEVCPDLSDVRATLEGMIHSDRAATINAWESYIREEIKKVRAVADEAKKTIASLGDREAELASSEGNIEELSDELGRLRKRKSELEGVISAKRERERHVLMAKEAIKRAEANMEAVKIDPEATKAKVIDLIDQNHRESTVISDGSPKAERDRLLMALRDAERNQEAAKERTSLERAIEDGARLYREIDERKKAAQEALTEDLYDGANRLERKDDLERLRGLGMCPLVGGDCKRGAAKAAVILASLDPQGIEKLETAKKAFNDASEDMEETGLLIRSYQERIARLPVAISGEQMTRLHTEYEEANRIAVEVDAVELHISKRYVEINDLRANLRRFETAKNTAEEAKAAHAKAIEAPCSEGSMEESLTERQTLEALIGDLSEKIETARRSSVASEEVKKMAKKMRGNLDAYETWSKLQKYVIAVQKESALSQIATPRESVGRIAEVLGCLVDIRVEDGELEYGLMRGEKLIPYRACSRGQRMLVDACLQYMFIELVQPGIRVLTIDDAEALGVAAVGKLGAALKRGMAEELGLDAVVIAINDSFDIQGELAEKANVIRL
jgi:DNA repair exonuclease SbcCD ATPase subunit